MPKERNINPAQAARKAEKAKSIKKGKAQTATLRASKLAARNPERLQSQLNDLKAVESSGGTLTSHEKTLITSLETEIKQIRKARETLGDRAPQFNNRGERAARGGGNDGGRGGRGGAFGRGGGVLGKRRRDSESEGDSDVPDDVKRIPMPRDTPPPFPKEVLDRWYQARRDRYARDHPNEPSTSGRGGASGGTNANSTPLGQSDRSAAFNSRFEAESRKQQPPPEVKTVYESAPVVRDLRKEAVAFVPAVVRQKLEKGKGGGTGVLLEPEEADRLEREGYLQTTTTTAGGAGRRKEGSGSGEGDGYGGKRVQIEEVEDEDG